MNLDEFAEINTHFDHLSVLDETEWDTYFAQKEIKDHIKNEVLSLLSFHQAESKVLFTTQEMEPEDSFRKTLKNLEQNKRIQNFVIIKKLGQGSLGSVYLAKQLDLDRQVVLKIIPDTGNEAKVLAKFNHPNIVKVFQEEVLPHEGLRLISMESLGAIDCGQFFRALTKAPYINLSQSLILSFGPEIQANDLQEIKDYTWLTSVSPEDQILFWMEKIARALAYAHKRGVLHLDLKLENILLTRSGKVVLTDFSVANQVEDKAEATKGGTLGAMSPEHEAWVMGKSQTPPCPKADIYGMGKLLEAFLKSYSSVTSIDQHIFSSILKKCLAPLENRYSSAREMAQELRWTLEKRQLKEKIKEEITPLPFMEKSKVLTFTLAILLPQFLGSLINILYNATFIIGHLDAAGRTAFESLVLKYNLLIYPLAIFLGVVFLYPIFKDLRKNEGNSTHRQRLLKAPHYLVFLAALGWLPGIMVFSTFLKPHFHELNYDYFMHFAVSFGLSFLISTIYTLMLVRFVLFHSLYLHFLPLSHWPQRRDEVKKYSKVQSFYFLYLTSGLIPLLGAILVLFIDPSIFTIGEYKGFRVLVTVLIFMGTLGLCLSQKAQEYYKNLIQILGERYET